MRALSAPATGTEAATCECSQVDVASLGFWSSGWAVGRQGSPHGPAHAEGLFFLPCEPGSMWRGARAREPEETCSAGEFQRPKSGERNHPNTFRAPTASECHTEGPLLCINVAKGSFSQ